MASVKEIFNALPVGAWLVLGVILMVSVYWFSDDIGSWWEERKQSQFDKRVAEQQVVIDSLTKERDEAVKKAEAAEAREQAKIVEADLLRIEASKKGVNIEEAQKKIDGALNQYENDLVFIEKVKTGEISNFTLCEKQCQDSEKIGYPCRPNYCEKFK